MNEKCNCKCKCKDDFTPTDFFNKTDDPWIFANKNFTLEKTTIGSWILYNNDIDIIYRGYIPDKNFAIQLFENTKIKK